MEIPPAELEAIQNLYDRGLCVRAYRLLETFGAPEDLRGTPARLIAARVLAHVGADKRSVGLFYRAYREDRASLEARYYYVRTVLRRRGPLAAWNLVRKPVDLAGVSDSVRAEWMAQEAAIYGALRDFDRADALLARAEELAPEHAWILVERSMLLEAEDRYDEALAEALRCLDLRPYYAPAVHSAAQLLQLLGRGDEALDLLVPASERLEMPYVTAQLLALQTELACYSAARLTLARAVDLTILPGDEHRKWAAAMASEIAYHLGEYEEAARQARLSGTPYFEKMADYIEGASDDSRRVFHPVAFVRQHHMTCAPATLSALSHFWQMPAAHLEIADAICYDGTPWHSQRAWAEENGWRAREFRVTWEAAVALLDRGVPFTLTTTGPGYAHLQAVIGYDERQGALLLRDPFIPYVIPALGREMLEDLRAYGPRGMAIVPEAKADLLDDIELQDRAMYDALHRVERALAAHRRDEARRELDAMAAEDAAHPVTLHARRAIAAYDLDRPALLEVIEAMRQQFPDEPNLALAHLGALREMGRREERLALLEELTKQPPSKAKSEGAAALGEVDTAAEARRMTPIYWQEYARELSADARDHPRAHALLARAIRYAPTRAENLATLGAILWDEGRYEETAALYRFAACLSPYNEEFSRSYFGAARWLGAGEEALRFLRSRFSRLGDRSCGPAETLFQALEQLGRATEAFEMLEEAVAIRPDDGAMLLFAADAYARYGRFAEAERVHERARERSTRGAWLRGQANLAALQNQVREALGLWREIVKAEPLALDAIAETARLLSQVEGPEATLAFFESLSSRFPHHAGIHQQWAIWLRDQESTEKQIEVLRRLRDINDADAWCRREMTLALARNREFDAALAEGEIAVALDPASSAGSSILGEACRLAGRVEEARGHFRRALKIHVDDTFAMHRLYLLCDTAEETRESLNYVAAEMARQSLFGDSILAFRSFAHRSLPAPEVETLLRRVLAERPDLWQAWSALIDEMRETDRLAEALDLAEQATARFPLRPALWQDLAAVRAAQGNLAAEREALEQALKVTPGSGPILHELADSWERSGDVARATEALESAIAWHPLDPQNYAKLAYYLSKRGDFEGALARLHDLLRLDPGHEWAWSVLPACCAKLGRLEEADRMARELTEQRPGELRSWMTLARTLQHPDAVDERLRAIDRALELDPRSHDARDLKAAILSRAQRFDEAADACRLPGLDESKWPIVLRARLAQIEKDRGKLDEAIGAMKRILEEDPGYYDGWMQLVEWLRAGNDKVALVEAAQNLPRLKPQEPFAWGSLGHALLSGKRLAEAKAPLRRALDLDPGYDYAASALVYIHLEVNALSEAQAVVDLASAHRYEGWPIVLALEIAVKRKDSAGAAGLFRELALLPGNRDEEVRDVEGRMTEASMAKEIRAVCEELLDDPAAQPEIGATWARSCAATHAWRSIDRLSSLRARSELGIRAAHAWISALIDRNRMGDLKRLVQAQRDWLREDAVGWGAIAYANIALRDYRETVRWTDDWQGRPDVRPWMLLNRVEALRHLHLSSDAADTSRAALKLTSDICTARHAIWLTIDAFLEERGYEGMPLWRYVEDDDPARLPEFYRFLYHLAKALFAMHGGSRTGRSRVFAEAKTELASARRAYPRFAAQPSLKAAYEQVVRHIVPLSEVWWVRLWALFHPRL